MSSIVESLSASMAEALSLSDTLGKIPQFPCDLLSMVLSRLPVKTLARSRCVCKGWNSLISSPDFIAVHLSSTRSGSDSLLILSRLNRFPLDDDPLYDLYSPPFDTENRRILESPPNPEGYGTLPVGFIHGVVCAFRVVFNFTSQEGPERNVILWNPVIGKHIFIPVAEHSTILGFGYDPTTKQLKVLAKLGNRDSSQPEFEIVSHRDRRWRKLTDVNSDYFAEEAGAGVIYGNQYFNGNINWLRYRENGWFLLAFDCNKEEFQAMDLPEELASCRPPKMYDGPFGDDGSESDDLKVDQCIASFTVYNFKRRSNGSDLNIWAMKEYGDSSSWTKLFSVPAEGILTMRLVMEEEKIVMWLMGVKDLVCIDFVSGVVKRSIEHPNLVFAAKDFKESLLLMDA